MSLYSTSTFTDLLPPTSYISLTVDAKKHRVAVLGNDQTIRVWAVKRPEKEPLRITFEEVKANHDVDRASVIKIKHGIIAVGSENGLIWLNKLSTLKQPWRLIGRIRPPASGFGTILKIRLQLDGNTLYIAACTACNILVRKLRRNNLAAPGVTRIFDRDDLQEPKHRYRDNSPRPQYKSRAKQIKDIQFVDSGEGKSLLILADCHLTRQAKEVQGDDCGLVLCVVFQSALVPLIQTGTLGDIRIRGATTHRILDVTSEGLLLCHDLSELQLWDTSCHSLLRHGRPYHINGCYINSGGCVLHLDNDCIAIACAGSHHEDFAIHIWKKTPTGYRLSRKLIDWSAEACEKAWTDSEDEEMHDESEEEEMSESEIEFNSADQPVWVPHMCGDGEYIVAVRHRKEQLGMELISFTIPREESLGLAGDASSVCPGNSSENSPMMWYPDQDTSKVWPFP